MALELVDDFTEGARPLYLSERPCVLEITWDQPIDWSHVRPVAAGREFRAPSQFDSASAAGPVDGFDFG